MKVLLIGRAQTNDIIVTDPYVSRQHAQLVIHDDGKVSIVDLNSRTGTYVNGRPVYGEYFLSEHDTVKIGNTILPWQEYVYEYLSEGETYPDISATRRKKLRIALWLLPLLLLLAAGGYYYYKEYVPRKHSSPPAVTEIDDESDEEETDKNFLVELDDSYRLLLPASFEKKEHPSDTTAFLAYESEQPPIVMYVYHQASGNHAKSKNPGESVLILYYNVLRVRDENFPRKIPPVKQKNGMEYMEFTTVNNDTISGTEALINPGGPYLYRLSFESKHNNAKEKAKALKIIRNIIHSFAKSEKET